MRRNKILCNFEIQIDHLIPARRPDLVLIYKKKKKKKKDRKLVATWIQNQRINLGHSNYMGLRQTLHAYTNAYIQVCASQPVCLC